MHYNSYLKRPPPCGFIKEFILAYQDPQGLIQRVWYIYCNLNQQVHDFQTFPLLVFRVLKVVIGALGNRLLQNPVANSNVSSIPVDYLFTIGLKYFGKNIYQINLPLESGSMGFSSNVFPKVEKNETSRIYKCFRKYFYQIIFLPNILCPGHTLRSLFLYSQLRFLCFSFIFLRFQKIFNE